MGEVESRVGGAGSRVGRDTPIPVKGCKLRAQKQLEYFGYALIGLFKWYNLNLTMSFPVPFTWKIQEKLTVNLQ